MAKAPYIGSTLPAKIVRTDGVTNLFQYAAKELGDTLRAWQIAEANGLSDFWPPAGVDLKIPQVSGSANDGLPFGA